jgi:chromate reductase, NAD(P)H dehydrogenase (quinone)
VKPSHLTLAIFAVLAALSIGLSTALATTFPDNCLRGKPVAVIGASTGMFGARWAQAELRKILKTIGASVLPNELPVASAQGAFTAEGRLREPRLAAALCSVVTELLEQIERNAA